MSYVFLLIYVVVGPYGAAQIISVTPMPNKAVCDVVVKKARHHNEMQVLGGDYRGYECFVVKESVEKKP